MLWKNLLNVLNVSYILYFCLFVINYYLLIINNSTKYKMFFFFNFLISISSLGFFFELDGYIFLLILSEFLIFFIFITLYSQIYIHIKNIKIQFNLKILSIVFFMFLLSSKINFKKINYTNFYESVQIINTNDFFFLYYFFFVKFLIITVILIIMLSVYSLFFIILYFNLKAIQQQEKLKIKQIYLLKKQNNVKQSIFKIKIKNFQK